MSTEPSLHKVGRLGSPSGLKGFIGVYIDEADLVHLQPGASIFLDGEPVEVRALRRGDKGWQVAFVGRPNRNSVESLRDAQVMVDERRQLDQDEFWPQDLVGLSVIGLDGEIFGEIVDVSFGPAQDRLVVEGKHGRFQIPFVAELVPEVDLENKRIQIAPIEGLVNEPGSQQ